jgi:ATP-dependent DNA helicase RecQ
LSIITVWPLFAGFWENFSYFGIRMQTDIKAILQRYWGHKEFRPLQEDIILSVLGGYDTLALLPTGGGKSVCFQVPAMARKGICIVVSPLIALMKDQVQNLNAKGIPAIAVVSGMDYREIDIALDNCVYGNIKFLYVSPERLQTPLFRERLKKMQVNLLAIDEAHCISQWGYDFRPPYLKIAEIRELLLDVPVLALTATATSEVVEDIQEKLQFHNQKVFSKSFARPNLAYHVRHEEDKGTRLLRILQRISGSGVVYVRNRKRTQEIAAFLHKNGITADFYHAGLEPEQREQKQKAWIGNKVRVICATNAFGMGIDKPDVRFVVHLDIPDSPEAYFQEAGRGGRDEKKAYAILLYNDADLFALEEAVKQSFPEPDVIRRTYVALCNYFQLAVGAGLDTQFEFNITEFCQRFNLIPSITFSAIKIMENAGYLQMSESFYQPSRIKMLMNQADLYTFQVSNRALDPFVKLLLRSYSGMFDAFVRIDEREIAERTQKEPDVILRYLKKLDELKVIAYIPRSSNPRITFTAARVQERDFFLPPEAYLDRKRMAMERMEAMKRYITNTTRCRSQLLLDYFGETETYRCGMCDHCLRENRLSVNNIEMESITAEILKILDSGPMPAKELRSALQHHSDDKVKTIVRWLLDNDRLEMNADNRIQIKRKS